MKTITVDELATELLSLYKEEYRGPFPYTDSRKLVSEDAERYQDLVPDLNVYFYQIASHCNGVKKVLKWQRERLLESQTWLAKSFFEAFPKYKPLESLITESNTPDLYSRMILCEKLRAKLLDLLSRLLSEQPSPVAVQ